MNVQPHNLYDQDFNAWAIDTASKLQSRQFNEVDLSNLIEEVGDMSKREISALESRLIVLIMHLLKWNIQTEKRCNSWKGTIKSQRLKIKRLLKKMPSLKNNLNDLLCDKIIYKQAVLDASNETELKENVFPETLPYTQKQILDDNFYPI